MSLTANHLRGPWSEGFIMGFAAKMHVENILNDMHHGTFILRFSDSELGGVSIAYVRHDQFSKNVFREGTLNQASCTVIFNGLNMDRCFEQK